MLKQTSYTVRELADGLRVDVATIRRWIKDGRIKVHKLVHDYIISDKALQKFLGDGYAGLVDDPNLPPLVFGADEKEVKEGESDE